MHVILCHSFAAVTEVLALVQFAFCQPMEMEALEASLPIHPQCLSSGRLAALLLSRMVCLSYSALPRAAVLAAQHSAAQRSTARNAFKAPARVTLCFEAQCTQYDVVAGGTLVIACWCQREETPATPFSNEEKDQLQFLYDEWAHPFFISNLHFGRLMEVSICP